LIKDVNVKNRDNGIALPILPPQRIVPTFPPKFIDNRPNCFTCLAVPTRLRLHHSNEFYGRKINRRKS
jgi:hypothetical protein